MKRAPPSAHRVARWILLALCTYFAWHGIHAGLREQGSDFTVFYRAGEAALARRDPTEVERFLYWPSFAVLIAPLAWLPYRAALVAWQGASLAALVWISARCRRTCERELGRELPWLAWLPLLAVLRLVDSNLANGQANLLVLAPIVAAVDAWLVARERRAGAWLGLATALKIVPGFLVVAFLWRRSSQAVAATLASAFALVVLLAAAVLGWRTNADGLTRWYETELVPYGRGGGELLEAHEYLPGQSLSAVAYRLLCDVPATSAGAPALRANVVALDPDTVKWIVRALDIAVLLGLAVALSVSVKRNAPGARLHESALVVCCALALAPLVHKAHLVWLIWPFSVLCAGVSMDLAPLLRRVRWFLVGLSFVAIGATTPALIGRALATEALSHDVLFVALACVAGALVVDVCGAKSAAARDGTLRQAPLLV